MSRAQALFAAIVVLGFAALPAGAAEPELRLARNEHAVEQVVAAAVLADICRRSGVAVRVEPLPAARANAMAVSGQVDGEVARVAAYAARNPSLVQVQPAYYQLTTTVFAKVGRGVVVTRTADLANYRVGYTRGVAHAEAVATGLRDVVVANDYDALYRMLAAGRIDVAIDTGINGPLVLRRLGLGDITRVGELARHELHVMLHPSRGDLAARIGEAIRQAKASGELQRLIRREEDELLRKSGGP